jgi:hypothetical protein
MFDESNLSLSQQQVINRHLRATVGKKIFIPDTKFKDYVTKKMRRPQYGTYDYLSIDATAKKQRPEKVNYWMYNTADAICNDVETMMNAL